MRFSPPPLRLTSRRSLCSFTSCSWVLFRSFVAVVAVSSNSVSLLVNSRTLVLDEVSSEFCFSTVSWSSMTRLTSESGSIVPFDSLCYKINSSVNIQQIFQATKTALDYMYVSHIPLIIITDVRHSQYFYQCYYQNN